MADSETHRTIIIGFGAFAFLYMLITYGIWTLAGSYEQMTTFMIPSADTVEHMNTIFDVWKIAPATFLVGLIYYVIERGKGTNITSDTFFLFEGVLIISIVYALLLDIVFGTMVDQMYQLFSDPTRLPIITVLTPNWGFVYNNELLWINIVYSFLMLFAYLGSLLFAFHPLVLQVDSLIFGGGNDEEAGQYVTNFRQM